jgi:uncharacterized membrane protein YdjX (TVP38/TMEM64 family)
MGDFPRYCSLSSVQDLQNRHLAAEHFKNLDEDIPTSKENPEEMLTTYSSLNNGEDSDSEGKDEETTSFMSNFWSKARLFISTYVLRKRVLGLVLIIGFVVTMIVLSSIHNSPIRKLLMKMFEFLEKKVPVGWGAMFFAEIYAFSCVLFLPGTIFDLAAGFLFGIYWGTASAVLGTWIGSIISFVYGRTLFRTWAINKISSNPQFHALDVAIGENSFKLIFLTRLSPVLPNPLLNYLYGVTKVRFYIYAVASLLGFIPMTTCYVYFGSAIRDLSTVFNGGGANKTERIVWICTAVTTTIFIIIIITIITKRALNKALPPEQTEFSINNPGEQEKLLSSIESQNDNEQEESINKIN